LNRVEEIFHIRKRNRELAEKLAEKIITANSLEEDLHTLQRIIQIQEDFLWETTKPQSFKISSVIAHRGSRTERTLIIDKGRKDNIEVNYPVISEHGVVGKILTVYPHHAVVLPISNPQFKLGVITAKTNVQGLLESDVYGRMYMNMIRTGAQVNVGDKIVTSSVSTFFPRGYPVGTVTRLIKTPEDVYMKAEITSHANINDLEQVIVLYFKKELPDE
jgi:rod shape-determining protein MreC